MSHKVMGQSCQNKERSLSFAYKVSCEKLEATFVTQLEQVSKYRN
jgi:hypothetical protein